MALVAGAIFRSGQIEAWGRGIERIIKLCIDDNLPEPEFVITPRTFDTAFILFFLYLRQFLNKMNCLWKAVWNENITFTGPDAFQKY